MQTKPEIPFSFSLVVIFFYQGQVTNTRWTLLLCSQNVSFPFHVANCYLCRPGELDVEWETGHLCLRGRQRCNSRGGHQRSSALSRKRGQSLPEAGEGEPSWRMAIFNVLRLSRVPSVKKKKKRKREKKEDCKVHWLLHTVSSLYNQNIAAAAASVGSCRVVERA